MMKWWGWGRPDFSFPMDEKPDLWPFIQQMTNLPKNLKKTLPVSQEDIKIPTPQLHKKFHEKTSQFLKKDQISTSNEDRILHTFGKSYPDLVRARSGEFSRAPDMILFPECHDDVQRIMNVAVQYPTEIKLIPFGGGTNIVGGVTPPDPADKIRKPGLCYVTVSLQRMNRLCDLDPHSQIATIEAGALGPKLEEDLAEKGWSLGHYPDSFEFSTLGGWIATRSAGMQSDGYGRIEDMIVSLKIVTPTGTIQTRAVPATSSGPDINRIIAGSEGTYGIITECTMRIHKAPAVKDYYGFIFPSFRKGVETIRECIENNWIPTMIRLQDEGETQLAMRLKSPKKGLEAWVQGQVKKFLKMSGYSQPAIMLLGFEGSKEQAQLITEKVLKIVKKNRGFSLGSSVGKTWSADKFNVPYLRDYVMDHGIMVDVAETAAVWSKLLDTYDSTLKTIKNRFAAESGHGYVGCHISHTYETGACLYFTYAAKQIPGQELEQYYKYKNAITQGFLNRGATLTHHHAVGCEHAPWLEQEISPHGVTLLTKLKEAVDPQDVCNPGKLLPRDNTDTILTKSVAEKKSTQTKSVGGKKVKQPQTSVAITPEAHPHELRV